MSKSKLDDKRLIGIFLLIIAITTAIFLATSIIESTMNYDSRPVSILGYFTIQSNIIVCIWFALLAIYILTLGKGFKIAADINIMSAVTTYILVTGIIYWLLLVPMFARPGDGGWMFTPSNIWMHTTTTVVAVLMLIYTKNNAPKSRAKLKLHYLYLYPIGYITYGIIKATQGIYLYPMFNNELLGSWFGVAASLAILIVIFTGIYYVMVKGFHGSKGKDTK